MRPKSMSVEMHDAIYTGPVDEVAASLAAYDGDVRKTVRALLERERALVEKLAYAEAVMGQGFTRGWKPSHEVDSDGER